MTQVRMLSGADLQLPLKNQCCIINERLYRSNNHKYYSFFYPLRIPDINIEACSER